MAAGQVSHGVPHLSRDKRIHGFVNSENSENSSIDMKSFFSLLSFHQIHSDRFLTGGNPASWWDCKHRGEQYFRQLSNDRKKMSRNCQCGSKTTKN